MTNFEKALAEFCWDVQQIIDGKTSGDNRWFNQRTGLCNSFSAWLDVHGCTTPLLDHYDRLLSDLFLDIYGSATFPFNEGGDAAYLAERLLHYENPKRLAFVREWAAKHNPDNGDEK